MPPLAAAAPNDKGKNKTGQPLRNNALAKIDVRTGSHKVNIVAPKSSLSKDPTDEEISRARVFLEPLVPMSSAPVTGENQALAAALLSFAPKKNTDDVSDLTQFIAAFPHSRWRPSLELNLGKLRFNSGYLSDALALWQSAWEGAKTEKGKAQKSVADRAVAELLVLNARLGRLEELQKYFGQIGKRSFIGSDEELVKCAHEGQWLMEAHPERAFKCGPYALDSIKNIGKPTPARTKILEQAQSTRKGTNLAQVKQWADKVGLKYQFAKRQKGAAVIVPAVIHWRLSHFAAIVGKNQDRYILHDTTFGAPGIVGLSQKAMDAESDGYFLVPAGNLPAGWRSISEKEAATVWGKGNAGGRNDNQMAPGAPNTCIGDLCCANGMARASAWTMNATLNIKDNPISYAPPIGKAIDCGLNFNQDEANQPSVFTFTNFGVNWSFGWLSYLTYDSFTQVYTVRLPGGGSELYGPLIGYGPDLLSQAIFVPGTGTYQRQLPDGTVQIYNQPDSSGRYFMTEVIDPQNNSTLIQYDSYIRITTITDAINQVTTLSYVSDDPNSSGFHNVARITDPFGRYCSFSYDATNTYLLSITDVIGLQSQFIYDTSTSLITTMTTPYGTTSFYQYVPGNNGYPARGLRFAFPDGTYSVLENWISEPKLSYFWDREATMLYPQDPVNQNYTHCEVTKFVYEPGPGLEGPSPQLVTHPLESQSPITYLYPGSSGPDYVGTINKPSLISRTLGSPVVAATVGGTINAGDALSLQFYDTSFGTVSVSYTVQTGDTLSSIATSLLSLVNASAALQSIGLIATTSGPTLSMSSSSTSTAYGSSLSSGATETLAVRSAVRQLGTFTVGGTVSAGNTLTISAARPMFPSGGTENVTYTVLSGDTLSSIAAGLVSLINADATLQGFGVSATSAGATINLVSYSPDPQTYTSSVSSGATETLTAGFGSTSTTQNWVYSYNAIGKVTEKIDPVGRTFSYQYASNEIDLTQVTETQGTDNFQLDAWTYNSAHRPLTHTDGSGQVTSYTYNSSGQVISITDPNSNVTSYTYTGTAPATIGGSKTTGDILTITVHDAGLSGGQEAVSYTILSGDTLSSIASALTAAINADTSLQAIGVSANAVSANITLISTSVNVTTYTESTSSGATETIALGINTFGYLTKIDGPLPGGDDVTTFTYDAYGRLATQTNSEGYTVSQSYDDANRPTVTTYPNGTTEQTIYDRLDAVLRKDRIGRWTQDAYDSMGRHAFNIDPLGRKTQYQWCACGSLAALIDPAGNKTTWKQDLQGRQILKTYANNTTESYSYELFTSRQRSRTDALGQTTNYFYNPDNTRYAVGYQNAVNPTASVVYSWDTNFNRLIGNTKADWGTYTYTYNNYIAPSGSPTTGGGMLQTVQNNVISNSDTTYSYDALGRTTNRSINGSSNSDNWTYDAISRVTAESNVLGSFGYNYVDDTSGSSKGTTRLASINYPNGQVTNFSWYDNTGDQRLQQITNLNPSGALLSQFNYGYDSVGQISQWQQQQNSNNLCYNLGYDQAGQLITAQAGSGSYQPPYAFEYYYSYDAAANRTSVQSSSIQTLRVGGSKTTGDILTIKVNDPALSGGQEAVNYTVQSSDTLSSIAAGLATAINTDTNLQFIGVAAHATGTQVNIRSASVNITTYAQSVSSGATESLSFGIYSNGIENAAISGTKTTGDALTITVHDAALAGGQESVSYTVLSGDTLTSIASGLKSAINADASLSALGVSATSASSVVSISSSSSNVTSYTQSTSTGATEVIGLSANPNVKELAAIGGSKTTGDTLTITVFDPSLTGGEEAVSYTVLSGDTLPSIASGVANAVNSDTNLQSVGISASASSTVVTIQSNSLNVTSYRQSTSSGATETIGLTKPVQGWHIAAIGGTKTTGDVLTIAVFDPALAGGEEVVNYTVLSGDTLTTIASGLAAAITSDSNLSAIGVSASAISTAVSIQSSSANLTSFAQSVSTGSTETITINSTSGVSEAAYNNVNELVTLSPGGAVRYQGTTNKAIKSAAVSTQVVSISAAAQSPTSYGESTSTGATETILLGTNINGNTTATIGGSKTTGDVLTLTVQSASLGGGQVAVSYTVISSDTLTTIATGLKNAINGNTSLETLGVSASASGGVISITQAVTSYTSATSGGATETLTLGANNAGNIVAWIGGLARAGDTLTITAHNPELSGGQEAVTYTVQTGDTLVNVASGVANAINSDSQLQALGVSGTNANAATLAWSKSFTANGQLPTGSSLSSVTAVDGGNNTTSIPVQLSINGGTAATLAFDANGNMTSDGTNSYAWDAENRLIKITYPGTGNNSQFTYDGLGQCVKIVETVAGSVTSTKQFVWCGNKTCEARNASGAITAQYFLYGQTISGSNYFYTTDHIGSIIGLTDSSGNLQATYRYDPYGRATQIQGTIASDFQFVDSYYHAPSGLNLTMHRAYSANLGRWLSRDGAGEARGVNLYAYVSNMPVSVVDPLGLFAAPPGGNNPGFPPCFSDCQAGDLECCETRHSDCRSRCNQFYTDKPGPGNDFYTQCKNCCDRVYTACVRPSAPNNPFEGRNWGNCFQNPPNKGRGRRQGFGSGNGSSGGGGWWPPPPNNSPPPKNDDGG
jgi:RHS repeat-associated protein